MRKLSFMKIDVSEILRLDDYATEKYGLEDYLEINESDFRVSAPIVLQIEIMKLSEGLLVKFEEFELEFEFVCVRSLQKCVRKFPVNSGEKIFLFFKQKQEENLDPYEFDLVDMSKLEIDLNDFLRQEVILAFPMNPTFEDEKEGENYASELNFKAPSCKKGLPNAAKDQSTVGENKPLSGLKDLFNF
jgi:uncharacterized metal-binding protein YceD (DUF177 family)